MGAHVQVLRALLECILQQKLMLEHAVEANEKALGLNVAFFGGSIMGLTVAYMGLFGIGILFCYFGGDIKTIHSIEGFC